MARQGVSPAMASCWPWRPCKSVGDTDLHGLHGSSDFLEPPDIQVPWHKIVYHDHDKLNRIDLERVINSSGDNKPLFSSYWRSPDFQLTSEVFDYSICWGKRVYHPIHGSDIHLSAIQAKADLRKSATEVLVLRTSTPPKAMGGISSHVDLVMSLENSYWLIMVCMVLCLLATYKIGKRLLRCLPHSIDGKITHSYLVLQVYNGVESIYVRMQRVNGCHNQIIIHSQEDVKDLMVLGYVFPVLFFD